MHRTLAMLLFAVSLTQTVSPPLRFGRASQSLDKSELTEIDRLANDRGKGVWLIRDRPTMVEGMPGIDVYLEPDKRSAHLWRGRFLRLDAREPPFVTRRSPWRSRSTDNYAYVVPRPGEEAILGRSDSNWPFALVGNVDDSVLLSMVAFVRSNPRTMSGRVGTELSAVEHRNGKFTVTLSAGISGEVAVLERKDDNWVITQFSYYVH